MHSTLGGKDSLRTQPIQRDQLLLQLLLRQLRLVSARILAHQLALRVQDFECHRTLNRGRECVIDQSSVRGIFACWLICWERRVAVGVAPHAIGCRGREKMWRACGTRNRGGELAQRRDVVKYPERTPVGAED